MSIRSRLLYDRLDHSLDYNSFTKQRKFNRCFSLSHANDLTDEFQCKIPIDHERHHLLCLASSVARHHLANAAAARTIWIFDLLPQGSPSLSVSQRTFLIFFCKD